MKYLLGILALLIPIIKLIAITSVIIWGCIYVGFAHTGTVTPTLGFFGGMFHGTIGGISLIVAFFDPTITMFSPNTNGWWYNWGFWFGVTLLFSVNQSKSK